MLRFVATLAFAVSFDILLFDGRHAGAVHQLALVALQHF
jgi:hypothetical protein